VKPHIRLAIDDQSQVGDARRLAVRLAAEHGCDEVVTGRVAIVVTELANNLVRHAKRGVLLLAYVHSGGRREIEVITTDHGPGMADVNACLRDGYSSAGTAGNGLGAVRRLSEQFSIFSRPPEGTVIAVRISAAAHPSASIPSAFEVGSVCVCAPGEVVSGDGWAFTARGNSAQMMVVDGLGHGPGAAEAAAAALDCFAAGVSEDPAEAVSSIHDAVRGTRGAAVGIATVDAALCTLIFSGVGYIVWRIISGVGDRTVLSQHGTAGLQIRRPQSMRYTWPEHSICLLHSDGLSSRWNLADAGGQLQCHPAEIAGRLLRDENRGRDDATVMVVRRSDA